LRSFFLCCDFTLSKEIRKQEELESDRDEEIRERKEEQQQFEVWCEKG